jgi:hypothetical protein
MPRQIHEFENVIIDSYREEATFMNALLLARFFPNRSVVIHNLTVVESHDTVSRIQTLTSLDALAQIVYEYFAIPTEFTTDAVNDLGQLGDAWN